MTKSKQPMPEERRSATELALELRLRKKELEDTEERFQLLVTSANDVAFLMMDINGVISAWNVGAERLFGYTEGEILGKPFSVLFTQEDIATGEPEKELQEALVRGNADDDRWHVRKDGSRFWVSGVTTAIKNGEVRGFAKLVRDHTHIKAAEEALRESEKKYRKLAEKLAQIDRRKDEFLAMLGHELRNPLAPICNGLYLIQQATNEPEVARRVSMMEKQARTLMRLLNDLLDVSRITRGVIQFHKEPVRVADMTSSVMDSVQSLAQARRHTITVKLPSDAVVLNADPTRLEQILVNLLQNAIKYTKPGGKIELTVEKDDHHVVFRVKDNGMGISPELQSNIFDLFVQAERTLERAEGGLGIGLTLVKRLVELHEGTVVVYSAGPGQGSEFIVRLPFAAEKPLTAEQKLAQQSKKLRVLIVEDVPETAETFAALMDSWGHDSRIAYSSSEALQAYKTYLPDVGLLDIGLPDMSGYELAQVMRKDAQKKMLLVAITGYCGPEAKVRAEEAGFDFHMTKPFDFAAFNRLSAILQQLVA